MAQYLTIIVLLAFSAVAKGQTCPANSPCGGSQSQSVQVGRLTPVPAFPDNVWVSSAQSDQLHFSQQPLRAENRREIRLDRREGRRGQTHRGG